MNSFMQVCISSTLCGCDCDCGEGAGPNPAPASGAAPLTGNELRTGAEPLTGGNAGSLAGAAATPFPGGNAGSLAGGTAPLTGGNAGSLAICASARPAWAVKRATASGTIKRRMIKVAPVGKVQ